MKIKYYLRGFGTGLLFVALIFMVLRRPQELTEEERIRQAQELGMVTEQEAEEMRLSAIQENELKWQEKLEQKKKETDELLVKLAEAEKNVKADVAPDDSKPADGGQADKPADEPKEPSDSKPSDGEETEKPADEVTEKPKEPSDSKPADGEETKKPVDEVTDKPKEPSDSKPADGGETKKPVDEVTDKPEKPDKQEKTDEEPSVITFTITRGMTSERVSELLAKVGLVENAKDFNRYLVSTGRQSSINVGTYQIKAGTDYAGIADYIVK